MCDNYTQLYVWHDMCVTWCIRMYDYACVWCDSLTCVIWLIHTLSIPPSVGSGAFMRVTWPMYMCDMTHSYVWHTYAYVWHDSSTCMTWLCICVAWPKFCDMTHSYVWHDSFICVTCLCICVAWLIHICEWSMHTSHEWVMSHIWMSHVTKFHL